MKVRQRLFFGWILLAASVTIFAQDSSAIARATEELNRLRELAQIGAISRARITQAEENLADARDEDTLRRLLYGSIGVESLTPYQAKEMVDAAQRRVDRIAKRYGGQTDLVREGVLPKSHIDEFERQLADRRLALQLAESRAKIFTDLLNMAKSEELFLADTQPEDNSPKPLIQSFIGSGVFKEAHLKYIESNFEKHFGKLLPISARGQTSLHTSLGFDHSGRIDVGVNPDDTEGQWLRSQLETLRIPYIALRAMIPGQSTAPHIHIGLPSTVLKSADAGGTSGLH